MAYKKFTSACDVWSYGCLLYEMWSLGGRPLSGIKLEQVSVTSLRIICVWWTACFINGDVYIVACVYE